jgi:hypothetical protein
MEKFWKSSGKMLITYKWIKKENRASVFLRVEGGGYKWGNKSIFPDALYYTLTLYYIRQC